jgi:hypothetical protein
MNHGSQDQNERRRLTLAHEVGAFDSGNQDKQCGSRFLPSIESSPAESGSQSTDENSAGVGAEYWLTLVGGHSELTTPYKSD